MRPTGYDAAEAKAFLGALSEAGRAHYLGVQHLLDTAYPAMLAAVLGIALWRFTRGAWRAALVPVPVIASSFDYLENIRVRGLLLTDPAELTDAEIAAASFATFAKSMLTSVAFAALLIGLALWFWRSRRTR